MIHKLSVDVHCHRPNWVFEEINKRFKETRYRIYIDGELMAERLWIWPNDKMIIENFVVDIAPGEHHFKFEPVVANPAQSTFRISKLSDNGFPIPSKVINDFEITFRV